MSAIGSGARADGEGRWRISGRSLVGSESVEVTITVDGDRLGPVETGAVGSLGVHGPLGPAVRVDDRHLIVPGFVDLQINGGFGIDLASEPDGMWELGRLLPSTGVTAFLPTIISSEPAVYERAMAALANRPADHVGAEPIGLHFEGPMLAPTRRGAHAERHLRPATPDVYRGWSRPNGVALVTLAPELPGALDTIGALVDVGVVVSGGHTTADAEVATAAVDAGMSMVTHLFNAMAPLGHRGPNLVGRALTSERLAVGLIVDGIHVDPMVVDLTRRAVGAERLVLVTDAVAAMGRPDGTWGLGDRRIVSGPDGVRRTDGTLAGSALTMDRAVANLAAFTGCDPAEAALGATAAPARVLGDQSRGSIGAGRRADLTVLGPDLRPVATVIGGRTVYGRLPSS